LQESELRDGEVGGVDGLHAFLAADAHAHVRLLMVRGWRESRERESAREGERERRGRKTHERG